jgi:hypothetical protein
MLTVEVSNRLEVRNVSKRFARDAVNSKIGGRGGFLGFFVLVLIDELTGLFAYIYCLHFLSGVSVKSHLLGDICAIFSKMLPKYCPENTALNLLPEQFLGFKIGALGFRRLSAKIAVRNFTSSTCNTLDRFLLFGGRRDPLGLE